MIINKSKIVVGFLSLAALLSVVNAGAVLHGTRFIYHGSRKISATIMSRSGFFLAGLAAYPWLRRNFFVSPAEKRRLIQERQAIRANDKDRLGYAHRTLGSFATTLRNVRDNSRDLYTSFDKQALVDRFKAVGARCKKTWESIKERWNKVR